MVTTQPTKHMKDTKGKGRKRGSSISCQYDCFSTWNFGRQHVSDDLFGDAYEYLIRNFASKAGKSSGEFYTPREVA